MIVGAGKPAAPSANADHEAPSVLARISNGLWTAELVGAGFVSSSQDSKVGTMECFRAKNALRRQALRCLLFA